MGARACVPPGSGRSARRVFASSPCTSIRFPTRSDRNMTTSVLEVGSWRDLAKVNPKRSFFLAICGAVIGLLLAGYTLFTARGTSTLMVPAEDVALVNQQPISRSDYLIQLQSLYNVEFSHATREQREKVLSDMIREELFVQRGKELDVASTDHDVRNALVMAVELALAADSITSQP